MRDCEISSRIPSEIAEGQAPAELAGISERIARSGGTPLVAASNRDLRYGTD